MGDTAAVMQLTVGELRAAIADVPDDHYVVCSPGGGMLSGVTVTGVRAVILDATPATLEWLKGQGLAP